MLSPSTYDDTVCVMELHGLTQIKLYDPHTSVNWHNAGIVLVIAVLATNKASPAATTVTIGLKRSLLIGQSTDRTVRVL